MQSFLAHEGREQTPVGDAAVLFVMDWELIDPSFDWLITDPICLQKYIESKNILFLEPLCGVHMLVFLEGKEREEPILNQEARTLL